MCGILGYINNFEQTTENIANNRKILKKMADSIAHRGPDAERFYTDSAVSLGFRRLAFIDSHGETSPLPSEDGNYVLLFNGEIYNYKELRKELQDLNFKFRTEGDAEVLLVGYIAWGVDLLQKLRGMFAFTIYDKIRGEIFMARDNFGIKPLYYYKNNSTFLFASELKAFLKNPEFVKEFDETLLPAYLSYSCVPGGEKTFFKNVKKLLPGHFAKFNILNKTLEIQKYFNVDFEINSAKTFDQYVSEIKDTFSKSVDVHMISDPDIKVGAFLSGGVDSAYTVAEVKKHSNPETYTIDFEESKFSEADDASHTAKLLNVKNTRVVVNSKDYLDQAGKVQYHMDEPLANPSANLLYFLSQRTSQDLKAVLSGEGADEMFGGYNVYKEPLALESYQKLPLFIRKSISSIFVNTNKIYSKTFKRNIFGLNFIIRGAKTIEERYVGNSNVFNQNEQKNILNSNFYNSNLETFSKYSPQDYTTKIYAELKKVLGDEKYSQLDDVSKMQYLDIHLWMVHEILQKADKMSMAHSLELRVPFLDIEIWKLGKQLPLKYKVNKSQTKLAERAAALSELDQYAADMKKRAFPSPLPEWLKSDYYQNKISNEFQSEVANKYFNSAQLQKLLAEHKSEKHNHSRKIWTIYTFLVWYREYFI